MDLKKRQAGLLFHPTSLPGKYGIGDLGPEMIKMLDWMKAAGFSMWQVLPLGPTGYADSPYQCFSAFAGNPYLISVDLMVAEGLLDKKELKTPKFPEGTIDYGWIYVWKNDLLRRAYANFKAGKFAAMQKRLDAFRADKLVAGWLEDYALFIALKNAHEGRVWNTWAKPLRTRDKKALAQARKDHADEIDYQVFLQFLFHDHWMRVREAAHERGLKIVGDIPIYVAYDSADTWANQHLFKIKANGDPSCVAGVPPDYFSETGQLWGNPIYNWRKMKANGYKWWISRCKALLSMVDCIRLDHFRGFEAYWEVPFGEETAINGKWVKGPDHALFETIRKALGELPIMAENLGVITPAVEKLRTDFDMPGMKIMQFGWGTTGKGPLQAADDNVFVPYKIEKSSVVYTGSHDNPTTRHWWEEFATPSEKEYFKAYLNTTAEQPHKDLVRAAYACVADVVLIPMQDILGLGAEARMNFPGREAGNWTWRLTKGQASKELAKANFEQLLMYGRCETPAKPARKGAAKKAAAKKTAAKKPAAKKAARRGRKAEA